MMSTYRDISGYEALETFFDEAKHGPRLLFLYDPLCGVNQRAKEQLDQLDQQIYMVNVAKASRLGIEVERLTGIRHESPQVILLDGSSARWHASHHHIRADAIVDALADARS